MPPINRKAVSRLANTVKLSSPHDDGSTGSIHRLSHSRIDPQDYRLHTPSKLRKNRQPKGASRAKHLINNRPQVIHTNGTQYFQKANLPWNFNEQHNPGAHDPPNAFDFFGLDLATPNDASAGRFPAISNTSRHQKKKANQWNTWATKVIPSLVQPALKLYSTTANLRYPPLVPEVLVCQCGQGTRRLSVMCLYWQDIRHIQVVVCDCSNISVLLIEHALFPCAPNQPSLAVDMNMLEFLSDLNNRQAPNSSAWCHTLLDLYQRRVDNVPSFDSLRKRFTNALFWYSVLMNTVQKYMDKLMQSSQEPPIVEDHTSTILDEDRALRNSTSPARATTSTPVPQSDTSPDILSCLKLSAEDVLGKTLGREASESSPVGSIASTYLRSRCPCCFGLPFEEKPEENWVQRPPIPDIIVQIDANFGQKRRHGANDPSIYHPYTKFLSEEELARMERHLDEIRGASTRPRARQSERGQVEDRLEVTGLPSSVLDACEATFEAADSRRHKASTKFFSNTGTMAILCRHEHVLFMANMTSAGEKQFYAFALIRAVISNLPSHATVGVLYDIGCQIHRSVMKWNLFPELQHRLTFAVSVFHAYGHEWPCQLMYNPRKCVGFGLSDGEGCERLWSSLKELIPNLRVTGHHKRLYILDDRIEFDKRARLRRTGLMLRKAYTEADSRLASARAILDDISMTDDDLRNEWKLQLVAQTQPLPSQAKNKAQTIINSTLRIWQQMTACQEDIRQLESLVEKTPGNDDISPEEADIMLDDLRGRLERLSKTYSNKMKALGVTERRELDSLKSNKYLNLRMNLRAKKQQIRERIRRRKFELGRLAKSSSHSITERKLVDHSEKTITRREPTILRLIAEYNKGCDSLKDLIQRHRVPRGVVKQVPQKIDPTKIFTAEMDESLWQDVGLEDDTAEIPRWLGDDDVRKGILALLSKDRALEELERIEREVRSAQRWTYDIILAITKCLEMLRTIAGEPDHLTHGFTMRLVEYRSLYECWMHDLRHIPGFDQVTHILIMELLETLGESTRDAKRQMDWEVNSETESDSSCRTDGSFQENCRVIDVLEMLELGEDRLTSFTAEHLNAEDEPLSPWASGVDLDANPFVDAEMSSSPIGRFSAQASVHWEPYDDYDDYGSLSSPGVGPVKKRKIYHVEET